MVELGEKAKLGLGKYSLQMDFLMTKKLYLVHEQN